VKELDPLQLRRDLEAALDHLWTLAASYGARTMRPPPRRTPHQAIIVTDRQRGETASALSARPDSRPAAPRRTSGPPVWTSRQGPRSARPVVPSDRRSRRSAVPTRRTAFPTPPRSHRGGLERRNPARRPCASPARSFP